MSDAKPDELRLPWSGKLRECMSLSCILARHEQCIRGDEGCVCECHVAPTRSPK